MKQVLYSLMVTFALLFPISSYAQENKCATEIATDAYVNQLGGYKDKERLVGEDAHNFMRTLSQHTLTEDYISKVVYMINYVGYDEYMVFSGVFGEDGCLMGNQMITYQAWERVMNNLGGI